jgi:voltage-gated potassium channel
VLARSRRDHKKHNKLIVLYLKRGDEEYLLPDPELELHCGDKLLFAGDREAFEDAEYIMQNLYELNYVLSGVNCASSISCRLVLDA